MTILIKKWLLLLYNKLQCCEAQWIVQCACFHMPLLTTLYPCPIYSQHRQIHSYISCIFCMLWSRQFDMPLYIHVQVIYAKWYKLVMLRILHIQIHYMYVYNNY